MKCKCEECRGEGTITCPQCNGQGTYAGSIETITLLSTMRNYAELKELQKDAATIPVLGLTANVNPNDLERFAMAGVDGTVLKPFDQFKLCEQVQDLLNKKKSSQGS